MCVFKNIYLKGKNNRHLVANLNEHNYKKIDCVGLIKYSIIRHCHEKQVGSFGASMYDIQSNLGYTNLSCTKSWIIRTFCPVPAKFHLIPYIKSLSCTNLSYTKPELYERFSRPNQKFNWFIRILNTA